MPEHILVVDDETDLLTLVRYNLEREGYRVTTATDGASALDRAAAETPDLVLLDVQMPGVDGFEVCRRLRRRDETRQVPILFLTAKDAEIDEVVGLELGADDYLRKPISPRTLIARVRSALRRAQSPPASTEPGGELRAGPVVLDRLSYTVRVDGAVVPFARKEFELLALLMGNRGRAYSREQILDLIWGTDVVVIDRTVDVHVRKVREKLGPHHALIETIKGVGYRFQAA